MPLDDPRLTAYALDELGPAERAAFEAELARDPRSHAEADEIRQCSAWVTEGLEGEPCPGLDPARRQAVLHPRMRSGAGHFRIKTFWLGYWRYGAAAGIAAAACAVVMWVTMGDARKAAVNPPGAIASDSPTQTGGAGADGLRPGAVPGEAATAIPLSGPRAVALPKLATPRPETLASADSPPAALTNQIEAQTTSEPAVRPGEPPRAETANPGQLAVNGAADPLLPLASAPPAALVPLALILPLPAFMGTPTDVPANDHLERPSDKPRPALRVPSGVVNVALRKPVTSSDLSPVTGTLDRITDGDKESHDQGFVELHRKTQWVQIDLVAAPEIYAIAIWHAHNTPQVYNSVVVQLADDADFTQNVRTVFNNDYENSAGRGAGADKQYYESYEGKLIPVAGLHARYVRAYSKGSSFSALNRYTEIEVYGLPADPKTPVP